MLQSSTLCTSVRNNVQLITISVLSPLQTKEEGKSLQQVIAKLIAVRESSSKQVTADLALIDIDHEFSPIASSGTTND